MNCVEEYLRNYLIPDYVAFFIFSAYRHELEDDSYDVFISSALDFFNVDYQFLLDFEKEINDIKTL